MTRSKTHGPTASTFARWTAFLVCLVAGAMVSAKSQEPATLTPIEPIPTVTAIDPTKTVADSAANTSKDSSPQLTYRIPKHEERYLLGPGDTVLITVFRYPELSRAVRIEGDGTIRLPLIHSDIQASCLTTDKLAAEVAKRYLEYLKDPQVDVSIRDYSSEPVAVVGAVNKPGSFALQRRVRLREILAFAGGPSPAAGRLVQIMHDEGPSGSACQATPSVTAKESLSPSAVSAASPTATNDPRNGAASAAPGSGSENNSTASANSTNASRETGITSTPSASSGNPTDKKNPEAPASRPAEATASTGKPDTDPGAAPPTTAAPGITYVDLVELMQGGATDPYIRPGDIINIPEASSAFVIGDVNHPTVVPLNRQIMLSRAIALAGGPTPEAKSSKVRIVRYINGKGGNTEIVVNLKDIYSNKREDIALRPGDIVQVPGSTAKSIMKSILWLGSWWGVYNAYSILH